MSIEKILACPIISINARVWRFWSFILKHDYMRYISIIPVTAMTVLMFTDLYRAWGNIGEVIINAYFAVLYFNAVLRVLILVHYHEEYESFLEKIADVYREIISMPDEKTKEMVQLFTKRARVMSVSNLGLGAFISACFVVYPLFTGERRLPYGMHIPGVNKFESPLYEILYVMQAVLTFPGCCMYIPFTSFFASTSLFGLIQIKSLQYRLENFKQNGTGKSNKEQRSQLEAIISDHQRVIAYVGELNGLVTYICLVELLSFGMMLCALLFLLVIIEHYAQLIIVVSYIFMIISQIFAFYWHANEVREESMAIGEAAYSGPWIELDQASKKKLLLVILRSQVPLEISVGNVYPMTLEMFQSLLNASYSYFTLLKRVYS
ncbi:AAEL006005-PA [Aedes aegypti]|uniref:Odorant receptor n=2 Tax=Aedes aegypti TaxID=7159 RepID=Q177X5_AEDAE|nr:odorant receptor 9 [Aedes aegypti]EAT42450.1 AAEL006005-PA [Aedes aegypti]DAA80359.1 TPA_exp: odorant receptor 9 [Aedes aegypti]